MASFRSLSFRALLSSPHAEIASSYPWQRQGLQARPKGKGARGLRVVAGATGSRIWQRKGRGVAGTCLGLGGALLGSLKASMAVSEGLSTGAAVADVQEKVVPELDGSMPELVTEFMVKMSCEGCVKSVRSKLEPLEGVKSVDVDLANQVVRIHGSTSLKTLTSAIDQTGREARLVGQGLPANFAISAAVAEFKGPQVHGVVRFAQVTMDLARIDASFSGLTPGSHGWSINTYGDLTEGAASTGGIFDPQSALPTGSKKEPLGDLGTLSADNNGDAEYSGMKSGLQVSDLIGRSVVVYEDQDKLNNGIMAAVIARSAGVGENYKKICSCDGTVIWESTNNDFVKM